MSKISAQNRYTQARNITLLGVFVTTILAIIKVYGGIEYSSHALFADGIHSFADLIVDALVLFASRFSNQAADHSHPYGHKRIETAATLFLAMILIFTGCALTYDAITEVIRGVHKTPGIIALPIAIFSIIANESLYHVTNFVGKKIHSKLIIANAWHHRSDALSSLIVVIGLIGTLFGYIYLDAVAAIIVGLFIVKMGFSYGYNSIKELIDTAVEPELLNKIEQEIKKVHGVKKTHQLRSRLMGHDVLIDVHIQVLPFISVSEGHFIAQKVHDALVDNIDEVKDVTVHVDPEDDEIYPVGENLPHREVLEEKYLKYWKEQFPEIDNIVLHYVNNTLTIDIFCNYGFDKWNQLETKVNADLSHEPFVIDIRFFTLSF